MCLVCSPQLTDQRVLASYMLSLSLPLLQTVSGQFLHFTHTQPVYTATRSESSSWRVSSPTLNWSGIFSPNWFKSLAFPSSPCCFTDLTLLASRVAAILLFRLICTCGVCQHYDVSLSLLQTGSVLLRATLSLPGPSPCCFNHLSLLSDSSRVVAPSSLSTHLYVLSEMVWWQTRIKERMLIEWKRSRGKTRRWFGKSRKWNWRRWNPARKRKSGSRGGGWWWWYRRIWVEHKAVVCVMRSACIWNRYISIIIIIIINNIHSRTVKVIVPLHCCWCSWMNTTTSSWQVLLRSTYICCCCWRWRW